jgi:hypothetical protein
VVVGFVAWVQLRIGGDQMTIAIDDIGEGVAALIAAICCALAARRNTARARLGWTLLSASAATWCAGEIVWSVYEVGLGVSVSIRRRRRLPRGDSPRCGRRPGLLLTAPWHRDASSALA